VRDGLRLLHYLPEDRYELFDLTTDPSEEHDLAGDKSRREQLEALSERLDTLRAEDRLKLAATAPRELTEEERQNLRALGYVE
jgi:arylsulfatase A-like enzyme